MKLNVYHRTSFRYTDSVRDSVNEIRLYPSDTQWQKCLDFKLTSTPETTPFPFVDFYRNPVYVVEVASEHEHLDIVAESVVETTPYLKPPSGIHAKDLGKDPLVMELYDFMHESAYVSTDVEPWRLSMDIDPTFDDVVEAARSVCNWIYENYTYRTDVTNVNTHMNEVIEHKGGVCQDFAHVMLGILRSRKVPARYASGYILSRAQGVDQTPELRGAEASHAWCELYIPEHGWWGIDPTNNQPADERYVRVAVGRDYGDIVPVKGSYTGAVRSELEVEVRVDEVVS